MFMPVPVYSESHAVARHAGQLAGLGHHALIVTGQRSAVQCGALADVLQVLESAQVRYTIFDHVEENPPVSTVWSASRLGIREGADCVIGIGGGSPLDAAKAIAYLMAHPQNEAASLYVPGDDTAVPLALIPTTCGTGSEVTAVSVLTLTELQTKKSISHRIFADLALIDGRYLRSAPLSLLRNTALDALTHIVESILNTHADDFSRMYAVSGLHLWSRNRYVLENGQASDAQLQEMMNASAMAGMSIAQTGTGIPHALSYSLTIRSGIPHGKAVGYFTAGYLKEADAHERSMLLQGMGFEDLHAFQEWYIRLYGRTEAGEQLLSDAVEALWDNPLKLGTAPFAVERETLRRIAFLTSQWSS